MKETATDDPIDAKNKYSHTTFLPEALFPNPLTWTWSITKGADLMWVPLPFEESFRFAYSRTFYGTGYYIYHLFPPGIKHISRPIKSWDKTPPDPGVLDLINKSGTDIAPKGRGVETIGGSLNLGKFENKTSQRFTDTRSPIGRSSRVLGATRSRTWRSEPSKPEALGFRRTDDDRSCD